MLGFDADEPPDWTPDAAQTFATLPQADQLKIMGAARSAALERDDITWANLSRLRRRDGWQDSYGVTPLKDLIAA